MDCRQFKDLVPSLVLGLSDDPERAACAAHVISAGPHAGCQEAEPAACALAARLASVLPDHPVNPRVWQAIERSVTGENATLPVGRPPRRRRELAGWWVAAAVVGLHFYLAQPKGTLHADADAASASSPPIDDVATLMVDRDMRRYIFRPVEGATARAALILSPGVPSAVILVDRLTPPPPGQGLHLWAVRGQGGAPALLGWMGTLSAGIAVAAVGSNLFVPALPERLLISSDLPDATVPGVVLLMADLAP